MIPDDRKKAAVEIAHALQRTGYFTRVQTGDERAASLFARLVALKANPTGKTSDFGWLRKTGGGFNVEGFADGAIVFGADPNDRHNVLKIVTQIGTDHAGIGDADQERREEDIWFKPHSLTFEELRYLNSSHEDGTIPGGLPSMPTTAVADFPPRDLVGRFFNTLNERYRIGGRRDRTVGGNQPLHIDNEGLFVWLSEFMRHYVVDHPTKTAEERYQAAAVDTLSAIDREWS